jgi:hypothetical protein
MNFLTEVQVIVKPHAEAHCTRNAAGHVKKINTVQEECNVKMCLKQK